MSEIYGTAWRLVRDNWMFLLVMAIVVEGLTLLFSDDDGIDSTTGGVFVATTLIALVMHRQVLLNETYDLWGRARGTPSKFRFGRFVWVSFLLHLALVAVIVATVWGHYDPSSRLAELVVVVLLVTGLAYFLLLVIFGVALTAAAVGDRFGLGITLHRAARTAEPIAVGLLAGPALAAAVVVLPVVFGLGYLTRDADSAAVVFVTGTIARFGGFVLTALAVAVLCRAYRRVAPPGLLPGQPPA